MSNNFHYYYQRYLKDAEQGNAESQYMLGEIFFNGENIPDNKKDIWMQFIHFGRYSISQEYFKYINEWEKGLQEAFKWYQKAAKKSHIKAQYRLGCVYDILSRLGDPLVYDEKSEWYKEAAVECYEKAANKGYADAQHALGTFYEFIKDNPSKARSWYEEAAEQGHAMAQYCLGKITGGDAYWFRKAAEQGLAEAQCDLGVLYHIGQGVPKDSQAAVKWLGLAARQGYTRAETYLNQLYKKDNSLLSLFKKIIE